MSFELFPTNIKAFVATCLDDGSHAVIACKDFPLNPKLQVCFKLFNTLKASSSFPKQQPFIPINKPFSKSEF